MREWKGRAFSWLEQKAPPVHRFLTRQDRPFPLVRDVLGIVVVLVVLGAVLWGYTGQSLGDSPVVVVESSSMMHCTNGLNVQGADCKGSPYGRWGTIDAGDLILLKDVDRGPGPTNIKTFLGTDNERYGMDGDVIIFNKNGQPGTPIIHRAMFYLQINANGTFTVLETGRTYTSPSDIEVPNDEWRTSPGCRLNLWNPHGRALQPQDSGYITLGDNNNCFDQTDGAFPVRADWILGKARGEIPWVGVIKLQFNDWFTPTENVARYVPSDVKVMTWTTLAVIIGAPFVTEKTIELVRRRRGDDADGPEDIPAGTTSRRKRP